MSTADKVKVVLVQELGNDLCTESKRHTAVIFSPTKGILVWIRPEQIAKQALVWHVCWSHYPTDLLHGLQVW